MYNIRMVAKLLGLTAGTIRAWENRYHVVTPVRSEGGHRLYSDEDVDHLRWLKQQTTEKGMNISQAAHMLKMRQETTSPPTTTKITEGIAFNYNEFRSQLYNSLLMLDVEKANALVDLGFSMYQLDEMIHQVFVPLMIQAGDEWEQGKISVAEEHLISQFVQQRCMQFFRVFPIHSRLPKVLAACPEFEHHQVGLLLFTLFLRRKGMDVIFLGANTPVEGIVPMLASKNIEYLCLSLTDPNRLNDTLKYIDTVIEHEPQVKLVLGGRGFNALPPKHQCQSYLIGDQLESWESWFAQLN